MQSIKFYLKVEASELVIGPKLAAVKTSRLRFFKPEHDAGREILAEFSFIPLKPPDNANKLRQLLLPVTDFIYTSNSLCCFTKTSSGMAKALISSPILALSET